MKNIFILLIYFVFLCSCKDSSIKNNNDSIRTFIIDPDSSNKVLDMSCLLENEMQIIPLETRDDCLISNIIKIEFYKDKIFISDRTSQKIFVFDYSGRFINDIGKKGSGPGEYTFLGDFSIESDFIYVQDVYAQKYLVYKLDGGFVKNISYQVHHHNIVAYEDVLYYISNYFKSDFGCYNLFRFNLLTGNMESFIPYDEQIQENYSSVGLIVQAFKYHDKSLLLFSRNDTIYEISKNEVYPKYVLKFSKRNMPADYMARDGSNVLNESYKNDLIIGLMYMQNSKNYILGKYVDKKSFKYVTINKNTFKYNIGEKIIVGDLFDLYSDNYFTTDSNEFVLLCDVNCLISLKNKYINSKIKSNLKFESVLNKLTIDDNPVLFKFKFKDEE